MIQKFDFLSPLQGYEQADILLSEHHEDFVTTIPAGYIQLALSKSCENEAFVSEDGRIFSCQFHPEYNYPFTKAYSARSSIYYRDAMQEKPTYSHSRATIEAHLKACEDVRHCIIRFI